MYVSACEHLIKYFILKRKEFYKQMLNAKRRKKKLKMR